MATLQDSNTPRLHHSRSASTRECPSCACEVAANQNRCPICGYEFAHLTGYQGTRVGAAILMLVILAALLLGLL